MAFRLVKSKLQIIKYFFIVRNISLVSSLDNWKNVGIFHNLKVYLGLLQPAGPVTRRTSGLENMPFVSMSDSAKSGN